MIKIPGGYILLSKKITNSEVFNKPPLYLKVWIYLLSKAAYSEYKGLKTGQLVTTINDIQEACSWYVGYRKMKPTKHQIYDILEYLRKPSEAEHEDDTNVSMITTTKITKGLLISIVNYTIYQDFNNYESNNQGYYEHQTKRKRTDLGADSNIEKKTKENKEVKNKDLSTYCSEPSSQSQKCGIISLTLNSGTEHQIYQDEIAQWQEIYPAVDVLAELRKMKGWCLANPTKRKTSKGITKFINSWLAKEQDRGAVRMQGQPKSAHVISKSRIVEPVPVYSETSGKDIEIDYNELEQLLASLEEKRRMG